MSDISDNIASNEPLF